jgi:hypothetical protein
LFKVRQETRIDSQLNDQMAWLWRSRYCNNSAAFAALGICRARDATYTWEFIKATIGFMAQHLPF